MIKISGNIKNYRNTVLKAYTVIFGLIFLLCLIFIPLDEAFFVGTFLLLVLLIGTFMFSLPLKIISPTLVDEVYDLGDRLRLIKDNIELDVEFKDINHIRYGAIKMPQTIVIITNQKTLLGNKFTFIAPFKDVFSMSSLVSDLYDRITEQEPTSTE